MLPVRTGGGGSGDPTLLSVSILSSRIPIVSSSSIIRSIFDSSDPSDSSIVFAGGILIGNITWWQVSEDGCVGKIAETEVLFLEN